MCLKSSSLVTSGYVMRSRRRQFSIKMASHSMKLLLENVLDEQKLKGLTAAGKAPEHLREENK